jgi:putative endopeptidase
MHNRTFSLWSLLLLLGVVALQSPSYSGDKKDQKAAGHGFDLNYLDKSVKPSDDFYQFAVGGWLKQNPIPDEYSRWGSFEMLQERNNNILRTIVESAASDKNLVKGTARQKVGDFYATGMDSAAIEKQGYSPIVPDLKLVDGLNSKVELIQLLAKQHLEGNNALFGLFASVDSKNSGMMAAYLYQGGLGLPDVEYYTKDDARSKEIRAKYEVHVANLFKLTDVDPVTAASYAAKIMEIETKLAKISNTRLENRDPIKTYNKFAVSAFETQMTGFDWALYFKSLNVKNFDSLIVAQPKFFTGMGKLIEEVSLADWKIYLKWNIIRDAADALSSAFENENFEFGGKFLNGTKAMRPRWKRILGAVNGNIGQLLGQLYVAEVFPPEAKARAKAVVDNLLVAMGERINMLEWMSPETKKAAIAKRNTFGVKIGYPDKWKDYSALEIKRDSYYNNLQRASEWANRENLSKIGEPVDKTEWGMTPQTVNAYYSPNRNEIVFPAAILQPPFFNPDADDAINYGAMGAVIGHEISHGFDDQGRKYDPLGNLNDWWTKDDNEKFQARAQKLIEQFNGFVAIDTFHVNGALTLGENIGDLGGLNVAFTAFKKTAEFKSGEAVDGFTPAQRFFLGWAQVWAENYRPEALKLRLKTDVHSPGKLRVLGPLQNMNEFYDAWNVKPGDPMRPAPEKQVKIW